MWRLLSVLLLIMLGLLIHLGTPRHAYACSAGPDFDPVAISDVIVEGRLLGYEVLSDTDPRDPYVPVKVEMAVERVFKGEVAGTTISLVDPVSLSAHEKDAWIGASGACGAFDSDPTGKYAIMGLSRNEDGTYRPHRFFWFFLGDGPEGERYERAVELLGSFSPPSKLPATGSGVGSSHSPLAPLAYGALMLLVFAGIMGTVAVNRYRTRRP